MITVDFSERNGLGLCDFLYESVKKQIASGTLLANEKLPSKRALAEHLGVSVITVQNAYSQLISEGYIYSIEKKGFYVTDLLPAVYKNKSVANNSFTQQNAPSQHILTDFTSNSCAVEKFPFSLWAHLMRQVINSGDEKLLCKNNAFGVLELRLSIAKYLKEFRAMDITPDQIVIGAGTENLYAMLVQLLGRETVFAVENPGYKKVAYVFNLNGAKAVPIPLDSQGINIFELEQSSATVAHVSPAHHFPTGLVMPVRRRQELLSWAASKENHYIIEDDYDSEFRFNGKPLLTLQSTDNAERVIYINTFSKTLSPSFRISYMVLPPILAQKFCKMFGSYACPVSGFEQYTLARFISEGHFEKHIIRMKNYYRNLRNALIQAIQASSLKKAAKIQEEEAGLHFLLTVQSELTAEQIRQKMLDNGIKAALLDDFFYDEPQVEDSQKTFVINYSGIKKDLIPQTVHQIEKALQ